MAADPRPVVASAAGATARAPHSPDLADALDALEGMVEQHFGSDARRPAELFHDFMSAGEYASEVLARLRPARWEETKLGLRRLPEPAGRFDQPVTPEPPLPSS